MNDKRSCCSVDVTVIIPTYNDAPFLTHAIYSVLHQTYQGSVEIIVVNDASTDDTDTVMAEILEKNPEIIYTPNLRSKGISGARNTGMDLSRGNYITFLDADDVWLPNFLERGVDHLTKYEQIDAVTLNFDVVEYESKRLIGEWFSERRFMRATKFTPLNDHDLYLFDDDLFECLLNESFIHVQALIGRRSVINTLRFDEKMSRSEDRDFCMNLDVVCKARIAFDTTVTGIYYLHEDSLSSYSIENIRGTAESQIHALEKHMHTSDLRTGTAGKIKRQLLDRHLTLSYGERARGHYGSSLWALLGSLRYGLDKRQGVEGTKLLLTFLAPGVVARVQASSLRTSVSSPAPTIPSALNWGLSRR